MFNAKNFICLLSWSIFSYFGEIHSQNVCCRQKSQKNLPKPSVLGFKVMDIAKSKKLVISANMHNMQQLCTYLQLFSHYTSQ